MTTYANNVYFALNSSMNDHDEDKNTYTQLETYKTAQFTSAVICKFRPLKICKVNRKTNT